MALYKCFTYLLTYLLFCTAVHRCTYRRALRWAIFIQTVRGRAQYHAMLRWDLVKSKCLPILLYGLEACPLTKANLQSWTLSSIDYLWNYSKQATLIRLNAVKSTLTSICSVFCGPSVCLNLKLSLVCIFLVNELMCLRCCTVQLSSFVCSLVRIGLYLYIYLYLYVYICLYVFMCLWTCVCVCVYLCVFATVYWWNKMNIDMKEVCIGRFIVRTQTQKTDCFNRTTKWLTIVRTGLQDSISHMPTSSKRCEYFIYSSLLLQLCRFSLLSGRNVRWLRRMVSPGELRWVCRRDRYTDRRTDARHYAFRYRFEFG